MTHPPCRLLSLPPELRDVIYEFTFSDTSIPIVHHPPAMFPSEFPPETPKIATQNAVLVMTCKQLYNETYDLYYRHTNFHALGFSSGLRPWLRVLPSRARKSLRHVTLIDVLRGYFAEKAKEIGREDFQELLWGDLKGDLRRGGVKVEEVGCEIAVEMMMRDEVRGHRFARELADIFRLYIDFEDSEDED